MHRLIAGGCALHVAHTNADRADPGVSDALARPWGWSGTLEPLSPGGVGRVGELAEPLRLAVFAAAVAAELPVGPGGLRVAGDPERLVRRVAVAGGAGDDLFDDVSRERRRRVRHLRPAPPPCVRGSRSGGPALIDAGHWATEWPWLSTRRRGCWQRAGAG